MCTYSIQVHHTGKQTLHACIDACMNNDELQTDKIFHKLQILHYLMKGSFIKIVSRLPISIRHKPCA